MPKNKIKKTILSVGLTLSLLFTGASGANAMTFEESYDYLIENDFIRNYNTGKFHPERKLVRKEATWLLSLSNYDFDFNQNDKTTFKDVKQNDFYVPYIEKNKRLGVMMGVNKEQFNPNSQITRFQTAAILNRAFKVKSKKPAKNKTCFSDVPVNHWAKDDVCTLANMGIIKGSNGKFNGNNTVTKAQFSMMYARMLNSEHFINEIDYSFEPEVLNNFYFQEGKKLVKVDPSKKMKVETIQRMIKTDAALKRQKKELGPGVTRLIQKEPLNFVLTKPEFINKNGGLYYHKGLHEKGILGYLDELPNKHTVFITNKYNDDEAFSRIFTHEFGHYLGFTLFHADEDFSTFKEYRDFDVINFNSHYVKDWGERKHEMFADSYTEIILDGFKNRTTLGSFQSTQEKENFKQWIKTSINNQ